MSGLGNKEIMAKNIRHYMELKGKDRNQICKDLGFKYTTFTDWINGNTYPRIDKIELMANYFGINKSDLVEENGLSARDNRDIKKDLDNIMEKLTHKEYGPAAYDGEDLSEESMDLFRDELEIALKRLKLINKEKYNPNKNKK
ncbi:helix-turn-helix transcriptional regulator [Roseburia rectibacter]|jgi:transcriptional regulator with XRE-family HTH domain|uniref:helix-turn-helix domain-containing protein n=1 Tax=Roseburia rectibacter TaxID=2763062 RepID=UPI00164BC051|nr:helix-turn-helix transcriptional regulator [Roseburia rectibacter]UMZ01778.1 helix-turn-helix transcriptional regulator [Roseburia rectibacter]DAY72974.1 MAG TPA: Repressor protein CI [Caudoviricetes sp.]